MPGTSKKVSRRVFTVTAGGFAAGMFATRFTRGFAQEATPAGAVTPIGYVSLRVRVLIEPDARAEVNALVQGEFLTEVKALDGYQGYVLADVIDNPLESVAVTVVREQHQLDAFRAVADAFVGDLTDKVDAQATRTFAGDLLMSGAATSTDATPAAAPDAGLTSGYLAVRVHTSLPGTDPREFVPLATSGFLPIVSGLPGFKGYLWFPIEGGFVAISLFDSEESALASNEAAKTWAAEFLTAYTDGNPEIIDANLIYADLPVLNG